jgi:hypothetical protein
MKLDINYEYVGVEEEPGWALHFLDGDFKGAIVRYNEIKIVDPENSENNPLEEENEFTLSFEFALLNPTVLAENYDTKAFEQYCGDVLIEAIMNGLEDGTAEINERESKQYHLKDSFK